MAATTTAVDIIGGNLPFGYCYPASAQQFLEDMVQRMSATMPGSSTFYANPPTNVAPPSDTNLPWLKINPDGSIDGLYTFLGGVGLSGQGSWVRPYPITPDDREHWLWSGSETSLWSLDGGDGSDPSIKTNIGPAHGSFWEVDHSFDRRMPLGPDPDGTPPINVGDIGGTGSFILDASHIPAHTHTLPIYVNDRWDGAVAAKPNTTGLFWFPDGRTTVGVATQFCQGSAPPASNTNGYFFDTVPFGTGTVGATVSLMDPYLATYMIQRTARIYITG